MTGDASLDLQKSVFLALSGDSQLALLATVQDFIQQGTDFPYVSLGDMTAAPYDSQVADGMDSTITIHSWSRSTGRKELKTIMGNVYRILHRSNLTMNGQNVISVRFEFSNGGELDPDGVTYHGVQRFRVLTQGV